MVSELQWEDFDKIHVISRLRELVAKWWNVQLNFTDEKGFVQGVPKGRFFNPSNKICQFITNEKSGFDGCMKTVKRTTIESRSIKINKISRCHSGFSTVSVPITVEGHYLGCVFGDGFIVLETEKEQKNHILKYLKNIFPNKNEIHKEIENLPVLSEKDVNYLTKLIEMVVAEILISKVNLSKVNKKVSDLESELAIRYQFSNMIGKSSSMQNLYSLIDRVCDSDALVLVQGENGTGKELIAKALHYNSKRKKNKFIAVNCGAFNENLLESELFGHVKGAFTGALKDKVGFFEACHDGTLFLDEIGETSLQMQVKMLRVLQERTFIPLGSALTRTTNARIVCATNRNLTKMVEEKTFREDLFYRLNVINLTVPPLRDRKEDIPLLIEYFTKKFVKSANLPQKYPDKECLEILLNHHWPGNIRELENEIERLCVLSGKSDILESSFLSKRISESSSPVGYLNIQKGRKLKEAVEELEKKMILDGLKNNQWNKSKLSKELGISRAGLIMKVEKYDLEKKSPDFDNAKKLTF